MFRLFQLMKLTLAILIIVNHVRADIGLHNPRGSNNKLNEQSNNVNNDNRCVPSDPIPTWRVCG